jgi:hypothetical protein
MSVSDPHLRSLYARLEEVLGAEHAETLMTQLPPRSEIATKADVGALERRFDGLERRFDGLEQRFDGLEQRFDGLERRFERFEERMDDRIGRFEERMDDRFERFEVRIDGKFERMYEMMHTQFRNYSVVMASAMTGLTAIFGIMLVAFR